MTTRSQSQSASEPTTGQEPVTIPRGVPRRYIQATLHTAQDHLAWCEKNGLPVGAEKARQRIEKSKAQLAAFDTKGATA